MSVWKKFVPLLCCAALLISSTALARQPEEEKSYTVACIGDSLTFGTGSDEPERQSWPSVLSRLRGELDLDTYNYGVYGSTVEAFTPWSYNISECYEESLTCGADVYLILLGSNDINSPSPEWSFEQSYRYLLDSYLSLEQEPEVIVLLPPDMYFTGRRSNNNTEVAAIREEERAIAAEYGLDVIDLSVVSGDMESYCVDGGHYNAEGYARFADYIYDRLCEIL